MDALAGDIEIHLPPDDEEDPHVRVVGTTEAVQQAGLLVRMELDPPNKVTMKMDVPWTHHSHIIGKGGNTIQPVVKRTGVSIHFPDGNKNNEVKKSNQVSINSRGEDLQGLEEARQAIRSLTPLVFTFTLSSSMQFVSVVDANMLILEMQSTYNVQVELRFVEEMTLMGSVRGCEWEAQKVKEATRHILQAYCSNLFTQVPIQTTVEVSPQHHSFVLGRNNEHIKRIMHRTSTKIIFPDWNDSSLAPLKKSTVAISGAIENVYLARQNIIGSLPLVLMFDLAPGSLLDMSEVGQLMQALDVQIILKASRMDGRRPAVVKGAEKNAENVYRAWRMLCKVEATPPKARIPPSYHIPDPPLLHGMNSDLSLGQWLASGSGDSSPLPSPTSTPTPQLHQSSTSLWGGLTSTALLPHISRPLHLDPISPTSNIYSGNPFCNGMLNYNNSINNMNSLGGSVKNDYILTKLSCGGGGGGSSGINLESLVKSMKSIALTNGDVSCGTSSNSDSSLSSPALSPRDSSPDQMLISSSTSGSSFREDSQQPQGMDALSALPKDMDRRAPGCEKKLMARVAAQKMTLSDYSSKKVEAALAMKQDVGSTPRTPTSSWSGYGFSKSMPGFMIRQKLQEAREAKQNGVVGGGLDEWSDTWKQESDGGGGGRLTNFSPSTTTSPPSSQAVTTTKYHNTLSQYSMGDDSLASLNPRPQINLSASNFLDCVLPHAWDSDGTHTTTSSLLHSSSLQHLDVTSILTDLQLPQYIDVFVGQEVDVNMFLSLEDYDLKELGITIFGHRKRILMAIKDMSSKASLFRGSGVSQHTAPSALGQSSTSTSSTWD